MLIERASFPSYAVTTIEETMYMVVNRLPSIPDSVTWAQELLLSNVTVYWQNGSAITIHDFIMFGVPFFVLPVGNWSLIRDNLSPDPILGYTVIDIASLWGWQYNFVNEHFGYVVNISKTYLKSVVPSTNT